MREAKAEAARAWAWRGKTRSPPPPTEPHVSERTARPRPLAHVRLSQQSIRVTPMRVRVCRCSLSVHKTAVLWTGGWEGAKIWSRVYPAAHCRQERVTPQHHRRDER